MRHIKNLLSIILPCMFIFAAPAKADVNTYTVRVDEFSKIKVMNDIDVRYVCNPDSAGYAVFTCEDRFADAFLFNNKGGTLKVAVNTDYTHISDQLPEVTLYSTFLSSAENQSKYTLNIESVAPCPEISFKQVGNGSITADGIEATKVKARIATGNGIITLSGDADSASFDMIGTGRIIADSLMAKEVTCTVFGTGSIGCWPIDKLSVKGMGSTTVYYKGSPATIKKSGIAKIEPMP